MVGKGSSGGGGRKSANGAPQADKGKSSVKKGKGKMGVQKSKGMESGGPGKDVELGGKRKRIADTQSGHGEGTSASGGQEVKVRKRSERILKKKLAISHEGAGSSAAGPVNLD